MPADKDRFDKIFALAIDPGAHEGEAQAAFLKLRELVREILRLRHLRRRRLPSEHHQNRQNHVASGG